MVNDATAFDNLLARIHAADPSKPCNHFNDGLKFVGRVDSIRKRQHLDRSTGIKTVSISLNAVGFRELDTQFFYDQNLADSDALSGSLGSWLAKIGLDLEKLFEVDIRKGQKNNSRALITSLVDLIVGKGISKNVNQANSALQAQNSGVGGSLQAGTGAGATSTGEAAFAYLVPRVVGALLGISGPSKSGGIMSYADILTTLMGVQTYSDSGSTAEPAGVFMPKVDSASTKARLFTGDELLGTFIPVMPEFTNRPLWSVLQQFLNPAVNEMYTALRVNSAGVVMPTMVVRQIPFTTEVYHTPEIAGPLLPGEQREESFKVTRFLTLPRWRVHPTMINDVDIGRSDATRINFVHVYGQDANSAQQVSITEQLVQNPPVRDDVDIQRSGLRSYMTTIACATRDQVGRAPTAWISLIADRYIGSQYTFNGTLSSVGIQAPIAEGDNLEWDSIVYHIESVSHHCGIDGNGNKSFTTTLTVTNGMRSDGTTDTGNGNRGSGTGSTPIYAGLLPTDLLTYDPGVTVDDVFDRTDPDTARADRDDLPESERATLDILDKL
jgi:hypothetical protein